MTIDSNELEREIISNIELDQEMDTSGNPFDFREYYVDCWLKGIGTYIIIFILVFNGLKKLNTADFIPNERFELILYLTLVIFSLFFPYLLGRIINYLAFKAVKIFKNPKSRRAEQQLTFSLSWMLGLLFNGLAIQKITVGKVESYDSYIYPKLLNKVFGKTILSFDLIILLILSTVSLTFLLSLILWYKDNSVVKKIFNEYIILSIVLVLVAFLSWELFYSNHNLFHLNVVLFPLVTILNHSPSIPMVSDGFLTLYGGYFLWMQIPLQILGSSLLSIQGLFCFLVLLQILMYFLITRCLIDNHLIRIIVFVTSTFWSYLFFRMVDKDIYFQYFPLRLLFPSLFVIVAYAFQSNLKVNKKVIAFNQYSITIYDILLMAIVAFALFNNFDSGLSTWGMYIALYGWDIFKLRTFNSKTGAFKYFILGIFTRSAFIVAFSLLIFIVMARAYPNLSLYISSTTKFGKGFFGIPFPDNLWILFVIFYSLTLIQYFLSPLKNHSSKFKFSIAIWGLISLLYFVNRSHPYNLLHISFPFFLCCGFLLEQSLKLLSISKQNFGQKQNNPKFTQQLQRLVQKRSDLFRIAFFGVFLFPFLIALFFAFVQFIPLFWKSTTSFSSRDYSQIRNISMLSDEVSRLENKLARPSILIGDTSESYFYLVGKRKILFYPETVSIFDKSFENRFTNILDRDNPIVTLCPLLPGTQQVSAKVEDFISLLMAKNFKFLKAFDQCKIYVKS